MTSFDAFWRKAMGDGYHAIPQGPELYPIEKEALLDLVCQHADFGQDDNWHAAVGVLREDGVTVVAPLTLARLDPWLIDTWNGRLSPNFSMAPKETP